MRVTKPFPAFPCARRISLAVLLLLARLPLEAATEQWKPRGLDGSLVYAIVADPGNARNLYALADSESGTSLFESADGGTTWTGLSKFPGVTAGQLAIASDGSGDLYATEAFVRVGIAPGLFRSADRGRTWSPLNRPAFTVFADPVERGRIWVGNTGTADVTGDRGTTWTSTPTKSDCTIISFARSPSAPSTLYAGTGGGLAEFCLAPGIQKSTNSGGSWSEAAGLAFVSALAVDPSNPARVVAGGRQGISVSENSGATWTPRLGAETRVLAVEPRAGSVFYAATVAGILRSFDHGRTWYEFNRGLEGLVVTSLAMAQDGRSLYAGTDGGIFVYDVPDGVQDLSLAANGSTRFSSFDASTRRLAFGNVDPDRKVGSGRTYGPYVGWTPSAQADGDDGATRLLWTHADGSAALWLADPEGVRAAFLYPAFIGLRVADVAAGTGPGAHILWTDSGGTADIWTVDGSGVVSGVVSVGPYRDWTPAAIADGPNGLTRLLWKNKDGRVGLSLVSAGGLVRTFRSGSESGWEAADVAVGGDGVTRILRASDDGRFSVRFVDTETERTWDAAILSAPTGMTARRIGAAIDGSSRVLLTGSDGGAALVFLSPSGTFGGLLPLAP